MEKYIEVINRIFELLETVQEGLGYVNIQMEELRHEEALDMINDVLDGMESIENALEPMMEHLSENTIKELSLEVRKQLQTALKYYEEEKMESFVEANKNNLIPMFIRWKEEIHRVLRPYVLS
ncbi:hypothetical protein QBE52_03165 [Clostridiaceae bacterium 35-E11]